jgi:hypothetical protein
MMQTAKSKDTIMKIKTLAFALALLFPAAAQAAEAAPAPVKATCCCDKGADGKMKCCDKMKGASQGDGHADHDMSGMDHK